jgi:hypothetical protein
LHEKPVELVATSRVVMLAERQKSLTQRQADGAAGSFSRHLIESHLLERKIDALNGALRRISQSVIEVKDDSLKR